MVTGFSAFGLRAELLRALDELALKTPTAIQRAGIPPIRQGKDVVLRAETGSGKTLAYGLPLLDELAATARHPRVLVLVPTRELALQVRDVLRQAAKRWRPPIHAVVGGEPIEGQLKAIAKGAAVLVGTPGRVLDLLRRGALETKHLRHVVLDEVDEMVLRGFIEDVTAILARLPARRQTVLASATLGPEIAAFIGSALREPVSVDDGSAPRSSASTLRHLWVAAGRNGKLPLLERLLAAAKGQAIVFVARKDQVRRLAMQLREAGFAAGYLQGDLPQANRAETMQRFRDGFFRVLVATDVAARGLDVPEVDWVINHSVPPNADQYVHRAGRAGRAGAPGQCATLSYREEADALRALRERVTLEPYTPPPAPKLRLPAWRPPLEPAAEPEATRDRRPPRPPKVGRHLGWDEDRAERRPGRS